MNRAAVIFVSALGCVLLIVAVSMYIYTSSTMTPHSDAPFSVANSTTVFEAGHDEDHPATVRARRGSEVLWEYDFASGPRTAVTRLLLKDDGLHIMVGTPPIASTYIVDPESGSTTNIDIISPPPAP